MDKVNLAGINIISAIVIAFVCLVFTLLLLTGLLSSPSNNHSGLDKTILDQGVMFCKGC